MRLLRCRADGLIGRVLPQTTDGMCAGLMEAHHAGKRPGTGMKCSDYETVPLCSRHHWHWHQMFGAFRGWKRVERRAWADEQIAFTQAQLNHLIKAQP